MSDVILDFKGEQTYLSKADLQEVCPLAFAKEATNPKVSGKYLFVNTETIIDDLDKLILFLGLL